MHLFWCTHTVVSAISYLYIIILTECFPLLMPKKKTRIWRHIYSMFYFLKVFTIYISFSLAVYHLTEPRNCSIEIKYFYMYIKIAFFFMTDI